MTRLPFILGILGLFIAAALATQMKCGSEQFYCQEDNNRNQCIGGKCQCVGGRHGRSSLACHENGTAICKIFTDPKGTTAGNEPSTGGLELSVPCKFLIVDYRAVKSGPPNFDCDVLIYIVETRVKGKFYVSGFEVEVAYERTPPLKFGEVSFRVQGSASAGVHTYTYETRNSLAGAYSSYTPPAAINPMQSDLGGPNKFGPRGVNKVELTIPNCGLELVYRAADDLLGKDQEYLPGLSVGIQEDGFDITYNGLDKAFCLTSDKNDLTIGDVAIGLNLKADHAVAYRAIAGNFTQDFPGIAQTQCSGLAIIAQACTDSLDREAAMEGCMFALELPLFSNCYSDLADSSDLLELWGTCLEGYCEKNTTKCQLAQASVTMKGCNHHASPEFVGFDCIFVSP